MSETKIVGELAPPGDAAPAEGAAAVSPIAAAWEATLPPEWLDPAHRPPPMEWILERPDGKGFLPRGKAAFLIAAGGVGKTFALIELAVCVADGRPWLDCFPVHPGAAGARVALVLGEETRLDLERRLSSVARGLAIPEERRAEVASRIAIVPLGARPPAAFMRADPHGASSGETTEHFHALRERLEERARVVGGLALVVIDPLSRFAGPEAETDNAAATAFVQIMETLTTLPGNPTVLVAHHTAKSSRKDGAPESRGSSGLGDGGRIVFALAPDRQRGKHRALLTLEKTNCTAWMEEAVPLERTADGRLRGLSHVERREEEADEAERRNGKEGEREAREREAVARVAAELLEKIRASAAPVTSQAHAVGLVGGRRQRRQDALALLLADGRLARVKSEAGGAHVYRPTDTGQAA